MGFVRSLVKEYEGEWETAFWIQALVIEKKPPAKGGGETFF